MNVQRGTSTHGRYADKKPMTQMNAVRECRFTALTNAYTVAGTHAQKNSGLPSTEMVRMWPSLSAL